MFQHSRDTSKLTRNIDQWFIEDMDNDGLSDIITNQEGQVKIIYGGSVSNGYSYYLAISW